MRVALVTSIPAGGPVEHARLLARELVSAGVEVRAVVCDEALAARFEAVGAEARVVALRPGLDVRGARELARVCHGADVVHSHDRRSGLWTRLAPRGVRDGVRVHSLHGLPEPYLPPPAGPERPGWRAALLYGGVERGLAARTDALVVPSHAAADTFAARLRYPRERLLVVPNAVDAADALPGTGELVGTIAALETVKGVDVFLRACAIVRHARPGQRFAIVGDGPLDGSLRTLARELGLADAVEFWGYVPSAEALPRFAVFALASHMETSGIALLEAMAAGVPAVATRVGGIVETAPDADLVPPGDAAALAAAIVRALDDPAAARERAARARERVRRELTPERTAEAMLEIYERALARRSRAPLGERPSRVLMVVSGMGVGGAERIAVSLATHLREAGHEVTVAAPAGELDAELAALGVARATFPERGRSRAGAVLSAMAVVRAVRASRAEIVHAHNVKAAAIAWAATRLARHPAPLLATFHGIEASDDAAAAPVLRRMERVVCVADALAERLGAAGFPEAQLAVIPNAVAPAAPFDGARRAAIDAELGLEGADVIAAVGRLTRVKAHDRFLGAAAELAARRPGIQFLLIGDGPERPALEALAAGLGIADRVRFTGTRADARDLIARAELVVFTSESEGLPLAALEAMDAGVPVLAPALAGMRELLAAGGGELLEDTRPDTIAAAAEALLDDAPRRARLGAAGRRLVRDRYEPAGMYAAYDAVYAALLESR